MIACLACVSACDNSVDPFAPGDGGPFAVFGYLDTAADTQFVRITRIGADATSAGVFDAIPTVTSANLQSGESVTWADSVITLEDGAFGLVFFASFDVQPSATYRLDVGDEGEEPTRAFTRVPGTSGIAADFPQQNRFGDLEQALFWREIERAREARVHYRVRRLPTGVDTTIVISYVGFGESTSLGWLITVMLERDFRFVRWFAGEARGDTAVALIDMSMSIEAPSEEWTVTEEASNIENGTGFFGSVGRFRETWTLDSSVVRSIGYENP